MEVLIFLAGAIPGFIAGALVFRKHGKKAEAKLEAQLDSANYLINKLRK